MKNTFIQILLTVLVPLSVFGATPIIGDQLQSDLDANNKNINNLQGLRFNATASAKIGKSKTIYIANREVSNGGDGFAGSGLETDPLNGGTATKFRDIINNLAAGTHVILGPGVFLTNGGNEATATGETKYPANIIVEGQGPGLTTIQLEGNWPSSAPKWCVIANATTSVGGITIKDLTIDANWGALTMPDTQRAAQNILLYGGNNTVENVELINMHGSQTGGVECFALRFQGTTSNASNNHARNVTARSPLGNYQAAIALFGGASLKLTDSTIKNCRYYGNFSTGIANLAYVQRVVIDSNYAFGDQTDGYGADGVYIDTGTIDDVWVTNNSFVNVAAAVLIRPPGTTDVTNVHVDRNYFAVKNDAPGGGHSYGVSFSDAASFSNCSIASNKVLKVTGGSGAAAWRAIFVPTGPTYTKVTVEDNKADSSMEFTTPTTVDVNGNRGLGGEALFVHRDNRDIQIVSATSGTVEINAGVSLVLLDSTLTAALTLMEPRNDCFRRFTVVDPKGVVTATNTVSISRYSGAGAAATINGGSSAVVALTAPYGSVSVVSDGVSGGSSALVSLGPFTGSASLNYTSIAANSEATLTLTVPGALTTGSPSVFLGWSAPLEDGIVVKQAWVSGSNTVSVRVRNETGSAIDPAAVTCRASVRQF
jgi:hypothetical protein